MSFLRGGGLARVRPLAETRSTRPSFGVCTPSKYPVWQTECLCYRLCLVCLETRSGRPPFAPRVVYFYWTRRVGRPASGSGEPALE